MGDCGLHADVFLGKIKKKNKLKQGGMHCVQAQILQYRGFFLAIFPASHKNYFYFNFFCFYSPLCVCRQVFKSGRK